ncbi:MAG: TRAP transporter large permease [Planctomycetales bacterium]|nr:TRAP transporter large permease [Planctomycetales bacterium]MCA9168245.1 TRAP transporter large permease [Planctomycetales bacterium]
MEPQVLILLISFAVLLAINTPVAIAIGLCTLLALLSLGDVPANYVIAQRMSKGIASFPLLAIPFFILAGMLMGEGGMARRLIDLAGMLVGRFQGGLAYVSTLTCMMFGAISGSATAAVSSVGGMMIPEMERKGFSKEFSVAITTTAATTGLLIPPSNVMIVYAVVAGDVSVAAMFVGGILPGLLVGVCLMAVVWLVQQTRRTRTVTHHVPSEMSDQSTAVGLRRALFGALPSLLLIVIVLAGILGGAFSATEASAIAVLYAFTMAVLVYREVAWRSLPDMLLRTGIMTSVVFLLISTSQAMSWLLAYQNIPQNIANAMLQVSDNRVVILLVINVILLVVGTFMDMTPAVLIFTPIFLPIVTKLGMTHVQYGIVMIANLCIGLCTPPVGTCLFVGCSVGKTSIARVTRSIIPFFIAMLIALLAITYLPGLSLWLPKFFRLAV